MRSCNGPTGFGKFDDHAEFHTQHREKFWVQYLVLESTKNECGINASFSPDFVFSTFDCYCELNESFAGVRCDQQPEPWPSKMPNAHWPLSRLWTSLFFTLSGFHKANSTCNRNNTGLSHFRTSGLDTSGEGAVIFQRESTLADRSDDEQPEAARVQCVNTG